MKNLSTHYIFAMVQSMYKYEASLIEEPNLLNDDEIIDFFIAYSGGKL